MIALMLKKIQVIFCLALAVKKRLSAIITPSAAGYRPLVRRDICGFISKTENYFQLSFHKVNQTIDCLNIVQPAANGTSRQRQAMVIG